MMHVESYLNPSGPWLAHSDREWWHPTGKDAEHTGRWRQRPAWPSTRLCEPSGVSQCLSAVDWTGRALLSPCPENPPREPTSSGSTSQRPTLPSGC